MRKYISSCLLLLLFPVCLICRDEVIAGAADGLLLWYQFVLPSLLPFMILVNIMMQRVPLLSSPASCADIPWEPRYLPI